MVKRTGQHVPTASTTFAGPSHSPHASTTPDGQQIPFRDSTGSSTPLWVQQVPTMSTTPESQHFDKLSLTPEAQLVVSTAQIGPPKGVTQTQAPFKQLPRLEQPEFWAGSEQNVHGAHASCTLGEMDGHRLLTSCTATAVPLSNLQPAMCYMLADVFVAYWISHHEPYDLLTFTRFATRRVASPNGVLCFIRRLYFKHLALAITVTSSLFTVVSCSSLYQCWKLFCLNIYRLQYYILNSSGCSVVKPASSSVLQASRCVSWHNALKQDFGTFESLPSCATV